MKYVDTSAFVKYYSDEKYEKGTNYVRNLIDSAKNGEELLLTSIITLGETLSVFDKWLRRHLISEEGFDKIISEFFSDINLMIEIGSLLVEHINSLIVMFSLDYIKKYHINLNDSIHLYIAISFSPEIESFVCSDQNLNSAAEKEGLKVVDPEKL